MNERQRVKMNDCTNNQWEEKSVCLCTCMFVYKNGETVKNSSGRAISTTQPAQLCIRN